MAFLSVISFFTLQARIYFRYFITFKLFQVLIDLKLITNGISLPGDTYLTVHKGLIGYNLDIILAFPSFLANISVGKKLFTTKGGVLRPRQDHDNFLVLRLQVPTIQFVNFCSSIGTIPFVNIFSLEEILYKRARNVIS